MHEEVKNRDWVKNAAIIFLVVILVLTFFSNTIMNRSLPEVASQEVTSGSIVARVRGTGTVQANSNTQVKMDKTRVIRSVLVKVGQQVEAGDVLFTLGEGASEEIDAAEEKLQSLQASYNRTAATIPEFSYGADQNRLGHLEEAYREALIKEEAALKAAQLASSNAEQLVNAQKSLEAAEAADALALLVRTALLDLAAPLGIGEPCTAEAREVDDSLLEELLGHIGTAVVRHGDDRQLGSAWDEACCHDRHTAVTFVFNCSGCHYTRNAAA